MRRLIWKSLMHRKMQNLVIILSVAMGVGIFFSTAMINEGVAEGADFAKQRMGADLVAVPNSATLDPGLVLFGGASENTYMPETTFDAVRKISGVAQATPQFFTNKLSADCHDIGDSIRMVGYDPATDWVIKPWLSSNFQKERLADDEIVLGAKVLTWEQNQIEILGKWYKIVAVARETGTTLDYSIFVNMDEARKVAKSGSLLSYDGTLLDDIWTKQGPPETLISAILVKVKPGVDVQQVADQILTIGGVQPIIASQVGKQLSDQMTVVVGLLAGLGALIGILALFQLFSRFYSLVWERKAEWGLYLAIGAPRWRIAAIIAGEAVMLSLSGAVAGIGLGGIFYKVGLNMLGSYQSFPYVSPSWQFVMVLAGLLVLLFSVLGALAAWLPAYRGSRVDPSSIMTQGEFN